MAPVLQLYCIVSTTLLRAAGPAIKPCDVSMLKNAMPSTVSPLVDWLILKAGFGTEVNKSLGLSYARAQHVSERFKFLCDVALPTLQIEAEATVIERLAAKAGTDGVAVKQASQKATTRTLRRLVDERGLFKTSHWATSTPMATQHPELLEVVREIVRANATDDIVYKSGETPVDAMLLMRGLRGQGGQKERFSRLMNVVLAEQNMKISTSGMSAQCSTLLVSPAWESSTTMTPPELDSITAVQRLSSIATFVSYSLPNFDDFPSTKKRT